MSLTMLGGCGEFTGTQRYSVRIRNETERPVDGFLKIVSTDGGDVVLDESLNVGSGEQVEYWVEEGKYNLVVTYNGNESTHIWIADELGLDVVIHEDGVSYPE
ncbi:hypothetical protein [Haloarchaeobius amylolyticus]|uniref:hypothetical protein n=1 Tax=Haloarchaeobius amylolyticus TaxID=1198296 RepID=UPI00226E745E|nr:hypothetical protein [Haloarchaeobius amylolyticus]